ncbi:MULTISPECIES: flagellar biosynthesis protein FlhF [Pseudothermotoga]|uniref:Flagellar biosynthesis protein FlhF n=1 Tax=Pseudothermotoga lettingae (strain ATCC BAA-301 / DSM 14385 / NBRC 107922 / TMO) TaxID=416591 RepID=A8F4V4_PSELT|nr:MULTISPECIES: flagellar biosynthesis protein FlhF [Pseudothermotoga]ABV33188.1 GTP-binding signal recognition particle SRP54 G- domain [Pseudothermotoga lettingae TMO]MDI3494454.1 flagellar biosynthesis protein FlhF [Pseudothermotoga sp.]MDK2884193.1 flagellar biosynthesis protein FlhF [Pseudothermotoga sp.]GLI49895.1 flagellar biosynthesis regulator FlhF [Pseudothermotoga lettingae TMO]HBJ81718.1 flagellar biosynthesis protein FlhF [Pseudothermotoga sp.]
MKIKKYMVNDIREALDQIKKDLGEDAVILSTRSIKKGGFFGIGSRRFLEVTAVAEEKNEQHANKDIYRFEEILVKNREKRQEEEIRELKQMLQEMKSMMFSKQVDLPQNMQKLLKALQIHEVDPVVSNKIMEYIHIAYGDVPVDDNFKQRLSEHIVPFVKTEVPILEKSVLFVGPTGVGKTTTLAKIAAKLKLIHKKQVAILTLDTYRIAATEQLKTYAAIMDIPMRVAYTPKEAKLELDAMHDFDVILIDTAGRSQNNDIQMSELRALVETITPSVCFLVVGMNCKYSDLKDIVKKFDVAKYTHTILTKMDETRSYGHIINISQLSGIPLAYITNGQRVPEDIIEANSRELSHILSKEVLKVAQSG